MSADTDPVSPGIDAASRDAVLDLLEDGIQEAHRKVEQGRVYDAENEKVRIKWIRALGYAVNVYRQTLKDKELEEMKERLNRLEAAQEGSRDGR